MNKSKASAKVGKSDPRRPGRPRDQGMDQRTRLLDAALRVYMREGIGAASLRSIATEAGTTPALVSYYFGGKEALLNAVVEERLLPVIGELRQGLDDVAEDASSLIQGFIRGIHAVVARHPWIPGLWVREILNEGGALRNLLITRIAPQVPQLLAQRFAQAQAKGELNPDLDPRLLVVSLIGQTLFAFASAPIWREIFNAHDLDDEALLHHTFTLLNRGLEARYVR